MLKQKFVLKNKIKKILQKKITYLPEYSGFLIRNSGAVSGYRSAQIRCKGPIGGRNQFSLG